MEQYLDQLAAFLLANVATTPGITWIIGDPGMSAPTALPFAYIIPFNDQAVPYSGGIRGVDMDTYTVPILVVDDFHDYSTPIVNANAPGTFEQPGYRKLMQYGQAIRAAFRGAVGGSSGIVAAGAATSKPSEIRYVWATIDSKPYRGIRLVLQAQVRRSRG